MSNAYTGAPGNPSPCLPGCSTAPGRGIFHQLPKMESLQYIFDILLQDSFRLFKPTLILLKSFPALLAGAPAKRSVHSCTKGQHERHRPAAPGGSFLGSALLVQPHFWIHETSVSCWKRIFLGWPAMAAEFQGWQVAFCGFLWGNSD